MNPNQDEYTTSEALSQGPKSHQTLVVVLLLAVLASIVGGYIYMGMWWAKQTPMPAVVEEVPVAEVPAAAESDRTMQIMEALEQATATPAVEDRDAIIKALEATTVTASEERKAAILEALNKSDSIPAESSENGAVQP